MKKASNRSSRLRRNTLCSFSYQITNIICNLILPRMILEAYGSSVNGLVNSIAQFLQVIGFLEFGIGTVVQSSLYKPLADGDTDAISRVMASAQKFFRSIAYILSAYVLVLVFCYPLIVEQEFNSVYTAILIVSISLSSFAQYYFGAVDSLLLLADQRGYVQHIVQMATIVLNTLLSALLIYWGAGIQAVKLTTSLIFLLRPLALRWYISRHYQINRKISYTAEPIQQKWNGVAQHLATVIFDGTDIIILTALSTLQNVSIYAVYHLVIEGVKGLFMSLTSGVRSLIGELWAKKELPTLNRVFGWFEWSLHTGSVFVFGCTAVLLVPFVTVYTSGVTDINYMHPLFSALLTAAYACHSIRLPYSVMILAGGHYKQTQHSYIIAAVLNVVLSVVLVFLFGLVGVAIGTLVAMVYQTVWMAWYISRNLNRWPFKRFLKQVMVDAITVLAAVAATGYIKLAAVNYLAWVWMAVQVAGIWLAVILAVNLIFYRRQLREIAGRFVKKRGNHHAV